ncbi:hypothetical protein BsWGS_19498 [Bradybaena similaris]
MLGEEHLGNWSSSHADVCLCRMLSRQEYWILLGCFSFVFIILASMLFMLFLGCVTLVEELLETWNENCQLAFTFAFILVAWWLIFEAGRFVIHSGALKVIFPP